MSKLAILPAIGRPLPSVAPFDAAVLAAIAHDAQTRAGMSNASDSHGDALARRRA